MCKKLTYVLLVLLVLGLGVNKAPAINGADISSLTTQEDFGVTYYECGIAKDCLTILKNRGLDLARIRLFVNPDTSETGTAMDLNYVMNLAQECKNAGMQVMLCIHYSDTWADPSRQSKPQAWRNLTDLELIDQVYNYTRDVVSQINPDYVQIGNEINCGMLWPDGEVCSNGDWAYLADLINAAVLGAEEAGCNNTIVHICPMDTGYYTIEWFFDNLTDYTTEFSIIGLSFYPEWHGSINDLKDCVNAARKYKSNVMLCEIADYYADGATEESQYQFVLDCQNVGASGVVYWEPAWVWDSTVGYRALFRPVGSDWKNVEMTLALEEGFGGSPCGGGGEMYVNDIAMSYKKTSSKYNGIATVWIMDDIGADVDGAAVYGSWSGATSESQSGVTSSSGRVTFKSSKVEGGGTFTFTVTDVVKTGYVYNPDLNVETSDSITAP